MQGEPVVSDIVHVIQLAVAPVFLLTGVATLLSVLANRLGRIIDRGRRMEHEFHAATTGETQELRVELGFLSRRAKMVNVAITLGTMSALLVCLVIAVLFVGAYFSFDVRGAVAALFVTCTICLIGCLVTFLREIFLAVGSLHFGPGREPT
ncbi:MAG TPA: DUF2721 domain-containing protein [Gemmatimonadaceae bacterium]|nr:DUF2721 domain-containing protein [Gemmatimonadaceae bacterium]